MIGNLFETSLGVDAWSQHSPGKRRFKKNVLSGTQKLIKIENPPPLPKSSFFGLTTSAQSSILS
jgi:hypothetical protein